MRNRDRRFKTNDISCRRFLEVNCFQSLFIGIFTSVIIGFIVGACIGLSNELMASPDELEELRLGFAEYTMYGMGFFGAALSGLIGTVGSMAGACAGKMSNNPVVGVFFGITGTVLFMIAIGLLSQPWIISSWKQETVVWTIGGITGASIAGYLGRRKAGREKETGKKPEAERPETGTEKPAPEKGR